MPHQRFSRYLNEALILEEGNLSRSFRVFLMITVAVTAIFLVVATVTRVDEAVKAQGQFLPRTFVHRVQAPEGGIVSDVQVREGVLVEKGALLVRLVNATTASEREQTEARLAGLSARAIRLAAYLAEVPADFSPVDVRFIDVVRDQQSLLKSQNLVRQTSLWVIDTQLSQKRSEIAQLEEQIQNAERRVGVDGTLLSLQDDLARKNLVSRMTQLGAKREYLTTSGEVQRLRNTLEKARGSLVEVEQRRKALEADLQRQASDELGVVKHEVAQVRETLSRLDSRKQQLELHSPVRGRVQDLKARTVGGVVRPGDELMQIVPEDDELNLILRISPKDIGFVRVGQEVVIKVTSYDFERYGTVNGALRSISPFTQLDERKNVYYMGVVEPVTRYVGELRANPILPGMWAQGEILTGQRSLFTYLVKPLTPSSLIRGEGEGG